MKQIIILFLILLSCQAFCQTLNINYLKEEPALDGTDFKGACRVWGFLDAKDCLIGNKALCDMGWTEKGLYFSFETGQQKLLANIEEGSDDALVSSDDAVEIFLMPKNDYYQFVANSKGAKYEALGSSADWDCHWKVFSSVSDNIWKCQVFIPFSEALPKAKEGDVWKFNICRDFKFPMIWASVSPISGSFHNKEAFSSLVFTKDCAVSVRDMLLTKTTESLFDISGEKPLSMEWKITSEETGQGLGSGKVSLKAGDNSIKLTTPVPPSANKRHLFEYKLTDGKNIIGERKIFFAPGDDIGETIYPKPQENIVSVKLKTGLTEAVIGSATVQGEEFWASVEKGETEIDIPLWFFKEGNNGISLKIYDDGDSLLASKETSIAINDKPVWLDCDLGLDDEVPAPWTPVEINNNKINVWGREYDFQKSIFPEKILSQNKDILASPIYFEADGKVLSVSAPAVKERKKSSVVLESEIGGLKGKAETLCEFDGLLKFDVTFEPGKTKNLTLNIPLNKEIAKNYDNYAYTFGGGPGFIMPTEKDMAGKLTVPYSKQFMPVIWVGDPARGMAFLCEGMENWNLTDTDRAYEIVEEKGAYVLKVHFMDTETSWDRPIKLTFGLNVTPVKPLPRDNDWLTFRPVTMTGERLFFTCWGGATRWQGFPVVGNCKANPGDPDEFDDRDFKKHITELRERKLNLPAYLTPSALVTDIPDLVYHRDEWKSVPEVVTGTDTGQSIVLTCLKDKGLQDCYIYYLNEFMNKYDVDAIYMDFSHCQRCSNPAHGCGYEKDGKREPAWPLFAYHDMHKRIYKVMQKCKPDAPFRVIGHCSGGKVLPHINFWDATVDGEYINVDIRGPKYNSDYTAFYSMDRFVTEYTAKGWGSLPLFMAYVTSPKDTETMFAYALQAGAVVWPAYMDYRTQSDIWTALDSFGVDCITDFLPYWENGGAVSWDNKNVYVGTYRNSKGKVLFAISNLEAEPEDTNIRINREKLGLGDYTLKDMRTGEAVSGDGDSFSVTVPDKGFRLIQAE